MTTAFSPIGLAIGLPSSAATPAAGIDPSRNKHKIAARDEDVRRVEIRLEEKPAFDFNDFTVIEDTDSPE